MTINYLSPLLGRVVRTYVWIIETLLVTGMASVVVIAVLQVFFRYVVGASLSWSEEALRYMMIWISSLGIGLAYSRGEMIGMNLLVDALPRSFGWAVRVAGRLLILASMICLMYYGWQFAVRTGSGTAVALPISMFALHVSIAVSAALMALHVVANLIELLITPSDPASQSSENAQ